MTKQILLATADAVEFLAGREAGSIDLIVTDPPYESLEKHRAVGTTTRLKRSKASSNDWFAIFPNERLPQFFTAAYRALRRDSHLYVFCDPDTLWHAVPAGVSAGFRFWKPIVWDKVFLGMGYHYRRRYEFILFFEKGKRRLNDLAVPDVLSVPRIRNGYPTEKPTELLETLVRQSTDPGDVVCDPFFGSGSTAVAAQRLSRRFCGADIAPNALRVARSRLGIVS